MEDEIELLCDGCESETIHTYKQFNDGEYKSIMTCQKCGYTEMELPD